MKFCNNCGTAIDDNAMVCYSCHHRITETTENDNMAVVYNTKSEITSDVIHSKIKSKNKIIIKFLDIIKLYYKQALIIGCILTLLFGVLSVTTITSEKYQERAETYSEYTENYKENLGISKSYGGYGLLGSGYERVADGWKDLAKDVSSDLWKMRIISIIYALVSLSFAIVTIKIYKQKERE